MSEPSKWKEMAERTTILRVLVGSQAYGLALTKPCTTCLEKLGRFTTVDQNCPACLGTGVVLVGSDRDEKGVCIEDYATFCALSGEFEQYEFRTATERTEIKDARSEPGDLDLTIYSLRKFLRLATYGNPNVIELLFIKNFLSGDARGSQLQELYPYIVSRQAGRRYLGYMEAQKQRLLGERGQMRVTRTDLIEKHGYDTKYASHVLRLGFQGVELLETGRLVLPLGEPVRSQLLEVKAGTWGLDDVLQQTGKLEQQLKDLVKDGPIQDQPSYAVVEDWMQGVYWETWKSRKVMTLFTGTRSHIDGLEPDIIH